MVTTVTPTLDELFRQELELMEQLLSIREQIAMKQAEFEEARAKFNMRPAGTPGRKPKVPT